MASTTPRDATEVKILPANHNKTATRPAAQPVPVHPWIKLSRVLGSLQLALSAAAVFTLAMIIGTCLESWYSASIAQELIYHAWWFTALLGLLASCIFFAAMKKWPWKKHQTGFLITHVGLLTLLAGGVLNSIGGTDAMMALVDSSLAHDQFKIPIRSDYIHLNDQMVLTVKRPQQSVKEELWPTVSLEVNPGPLPWGSELGQSIPIPGLIRTFSMLANPLSRAINRKLFEDAKLEVVGFLPHCRVEPLETAGGKEFGFPALKLEVNYKEPGSTNGVRIRPSWIVLTSEREMNLFPYLTNTFRSGKLVEFLGNCPVSLIDEFLKPPSDEERGTQGQLVFNMAGEKIKINVAKEMGKTVPLGPSGWKVKLEKFLPRPDSVNPTDPPDFPCVLCDVIAPDGKITKYRAAGRIIAYPGPLDHLGTQTFELESGLPSVWYHAPDVRYGYDGTARERPQIKMMLQFAQTDEGKLYYRSWLEKSGKMMLEDAGEAPSSGVAKKIWENQAGNFIIQEHIPHAKPTSQRVVPMAKRPGLMDEEHPPALLCRVTVTRKDSTGKPKTFSTEKWVPLTGKQVMRRGPTLLGVSGVVDGASFTDQFMIYFGYKQLRLDFSLELTRAESQVDAGTERAATYTSFVKLYDDSQNIYGEDYMITMNEPLNHRGFKVYQTNFSDFGIDDETGKPLAGSVFTVGRDPGLWLKYLGTAMLGLGIATMYYMKAYFFKPKARQLAG